MQNYKTRSSMWIDHIQFKDSKSFLLSFKFEFKIFGSSCPNFTFSDFFEFDVFLQSTTLNHFKKILKKRRNIEK